MIKLMEYPVGNYDCIPLQVGNTLAMILRYRYGSCKKTTISNIRRTLQSIEEKKRQLKKLIGHQYHPI
jgi:hypothetical protein